MFSWLFSKPLEPGTLAPAFICRDDQGSVFILNQQRGKYVVLIFYPGDNTPICTRQLCEFRDQWEKLKERNTAVYGVNPGDRERHSRFRARHHLPFPLLVDDSQRVAKLYKASGLIVKRTVYLVNKTGVIVYARRGRPPVEEVLSVVERGA
jgi:peroxiredoxin Q/BCP